MATNPHLSILICRLETRVLEFARLFSVLQPQIEKAGIHRVELLMELDDGSMSTGAKRNKLLQQATGDFVAFIDDDDLVHNSYVDWVLEASRLQVNGELPHCVGMSGIITTGRMARENPRTFVHQLGITEWHERGGVYYRYPNHLNPIRRDLAQQVKFPEIDVGEDRAWSTAIYPYLHTQRVITVPIYYYLAA